MKLPRDHPESYHTYMWTNFFKHIDIDPANVHILDGNAPDLVAECDKFEEKIKAVGGVELFVGGKGKTGVLFVTVVVQVLVLMDTLPSMNRDHRLCLGQESRHCLRRQ